jgi:two-component system response regulator FixJ
MTEMPVEQTVFVVDDDRQARESVCALVRSLGLRAESFASAEEFLASFTPDRAGCLVTDVRMLGMSGVELQQKLNEAGAPLPVIVLTAYARTPLTVKVMQQGALTLLEKPYEEDDLWDAIRRALAQDTNRRQQHEHVERIRGRLASLTDKEREVLDGIVAGKPNKNIARELDVSIRTVENRRRDIFAKTQTDSVAELVRMVIDAEAGS